MKMAYDILWVDDQPQEVADLRDNAVDFLSEFGISANVTLVQARRDEDIRESMRLDLQNRDLDMLVVDYHLPGMGGDELVHLIRYSDHIYLPVIFYSSRDVSEVYKSAHEKKLDGIYITSKENFDAKFNAVVRSLLYKEHSVKQTRGLLMEEVSELDARLKEVFEKGWRKLSYARREQLARYVRRVVAQKTRDAEKLERNISPEIEEFESVMVNDLKTAKFDTMTRWKIAKKILEYVDFDKEKQELFHGLAGRIRNGSQPLSSIRNKYAHQTRAELESEHTLEKCIDIRTKIRTQQENLDSILNSLCRTS